MGVVSFWVYPPVVLYQVSVYLMRIRDSRVDKRFAPIKVSFIPVKGSHRFHIKNTNRHYADPLNPQIKLDQRLMVTMTMACHAERGPRQRASVVLPTIVIVRSLRLESGRR